MRKSPSEIAKHIFEVWGDECERVGATTFSRHSLECLKGEIVKAIKAERARFTSPSEEDIDLLSLEWDDYCRKTFLNYEEMRPRYAYKEGFRAAFRWLEKRE